MTNIPNPIQKHPMKTIDHFKWLIYEATINIGVAVDGTVSVNGGLVSKGEIKAGSPMGLGDA